MTASMTNEFDPDRFPMLAQFAGGYLHEDFVQEHRTVWAARDAFLSDASPEERAQFQREAEQFLAQAARVRWADVSAAFLRLGGAWRPRCRADLVALLRKHT